MQFEKQSRRNMVKSMLKVDFLRMFTMPLVYIMAGISIVMPVLILVMTSMMSSSEGAAAFTSVWQAVSSLSTSNAMSMDLVSMCNINLIYFIAAVPVCKFIADDYRSGYAKNIFTVHPCKTDYVLSKTLAGIVCGVIMLLCYIIGAMIGGAIAGLSFAADGAGAGQIIMCIIAKLFLMFVFVSIFTVMGVIAKQRLWLSIILSLCAGMLLYTMIPMMTPLDCSFLNLIMCVAGGVLFAAGLGAVSRLILKRKPM